MPAAKDSIERAVLAPSAALSQDSSATDRWKAWDEFLEATPEAGFMQTSWWADLRSTAGYDHFAAILKNHGAILGGAVVLKYYPTPESCFYYIPDGPVLPADEPAAAEVFAALLNAIEDERKSERLPISHLRIEPRWARLPSFVSGFRARPVLGDAYMEPRDTLCVDLRPTEAEILAQMKPKGRYNIRVAQKHCVTIFEETLEKGVAEFLAIYGETASRHGLNAKPPDYFQDIVTLLAPLQRCALFFAEHEGVRLAAALIIYFGRRATYFFGGSLPTRRHVMAPHLLHFEIMRDAKARGHQWYDFWGIAPDNDPNHPWWDITVFKRKFGGAEFNLVRTADYVFDAASYDAYLSRK